MCVCVSVSFSFLLQDFTLFQLAQARDVEHQRLQMDLNDTHQLADNVEVLVRPVPVPIDAAYNLASGDIVGADQASMTASIAAAKAAGRASTIDSLDSRIAAGGSGLATASNVSVSLLIRVPMQLAGLPHYHASTDDTRVSCAVRAFYSFEHGAWQAPNERQATIKSQVLMSRHAVTLMRASITHIVTTAKFTLNDTLAQYAVAVGRDVNERVQLMQTSHRACVAFIGTALGVFAADLVEADLTHYRSLAFVAQVSPNTSAHQSVVVIISLPDDFPTACPLLTLQSSFYSEKGLLYKRDFRNNADASLGFPYSPRWDPTTITERIKYVSHPTYPVSERK